MAVLIEAYSVLIKCSAIDAAYEGGWNAFWQDVPNATACTDGELVRVGFMAFDDMVAYADLIEKRGLKDIEKDRAVDYVAVQQDDGPLFPCDWLEGGSKEFEGLGKVVWGRLRGGKSAEVHLPDSWDGPTIFTRHHADTADLELLRRDGEVEVYRDLRTGQEVFCGRTDRPPEKQCLKHRGRFR